MMDGLVLASTPPCCRCFSRSLLCFLTVVQPSVDGCQAVAVKSIGASFIIGTRGPAVTVLYSRISRWFCGVNDDTLVKPDRMLE